ncbi:MAG: tRNA (adenosine(37)-N6)-threonylcarbamoyltransferase complex ATPase subunit type 1 TsaE [Saprospiraceae bacterium]|nr:tRNA (adenosine(37)-N6)-threonylcarbamoyltransferase complex ATPase subunit type 1 TsaE [Saprospiraceae bacterium]
MINIEYIAGIDEVGEIANAMLKELSPYRIWLLRGEMGSGKTTLVRSIAGLLGEAKEASSPTYTLVNEYHFITNKHGIRKLYHLDLFRIRNVEEALEIGIEEILEDDSKCIIEWPEIILPLLQDESVINIFIENTKEGKRKYRLTNDNQ